jgi:hypothetical protein
MTRIFPRRSQFIPLTLALLLAACAAPKAPPPAAAPPVPPAQAPLVQANEDWRDIALTPGTWRYAAGEAVYGVPGAPVFTMRCDPAQRVVVISRARASGMAPGGAAGSLVVQTSAGTQAFAGAAGGLGVQASLRALDPFLDKIAFSRGRFTVSLAGAPRLVIPAWAEPGRVIEDCR